MSDDMGDAAAVGGLDHLLQALLLAGMESERRPGLLVLDYDGTLAPFQARRENARPYPGVRAALAALPVAGPGRFVIVSGREAQSVRSLLGLSPAPEIWGGHGSERLFVSGEMLLARLTPEQEEAFRLARSMTANWSCPSSQLERKRCSLALHTRALGTEEAGRLLHAARRDWKEPADRAGLELYSFDGGLELRVPGLDKGAALRALMRENPDALVAYLGDDQTDEDAFAALGPNNLAVLVRGRYRPTAAAFWIRPPKELLRFLSAWGSL